MSKKLKITVTIEDENGKMLVSNESEREVPFLEEVEEQGFRAAFHEYETAVLETRKEVSDAITSEYFEMISKKKPELREAMKKQLEKKDMV